MATIDKESMKKTEGKAAYIKSSFDLRKLEHRDAKTGRVIRQNNYRMRVVNKQKFIEWPINSGNLYYEAGDGAGRIEEGVIYLGKSHQEYVLTQDEKISRESAQVKQENARLMKELAEIKNEQDMKKFKEQIEGKGAKSNHKDTKDGNKRRSSASPANS
jgi:hypothetical protein